MPSDGGPEASERSVPVMIPLSLYKRIEKAIKDTGFEDVSDFVVHVVREFLASTEEGEEELTKEDEIKILDRLRKLGYI